MPLTASSIDRMGERLLARGIFQAGEEGQAEPECRAFQDRCDNWHDRETGKLISKTEGQAHYDRWQIERRWL